MTSRIDNHSFLSKPPLSTAEIVPYRAFYYDDEMCRILEIELEQGKRYLLYITAGEETKRVSFEKFQKNAYLIGLSNLNVSKEWE